MHVRSTTGTETTIDEETTEAFSAELRGALLQPGDAQYDEARQIWNAMIDRRPALIARCAGTADVMTAVRFAREHDVLVSIKGAGHNVAGSAVCEGGLMIDLSEMASVRVDPAPKTARVGPGVTLADFDHEAQAFGLATPVGFNSTTGIAGLTLGGGFGWLSRTYGLTVDNLRSADVVTADGSFLRASENENADLFWGLRGGGGNFGVVTSFAFDLHEVGPEVFSGPIVYAYDDARAVLRNLRDFNAVAPDELTCWAVLRKAPPLPFLPEEVHGHEVVIVIAFCAGDLTEGKRLLAPLRAFGDPIADAVGPHPYAAFQQAFDPLLTEGARNYWKTHNFARLSDEVIDVAVEYAATLPSPQTEVPIAQLGGAIRRVAPDATAYPHREAEYLINVHTRWEDPAQDDVCVAWARDFYDAMTPYALGSAYVNFISESEGEEQTAYGANYNRLVALKNKYDPTNFFRMNQNVQPAG